MNASPFSRSFAPLFLGMFALMLLATGPVLAADKGAAVGEEAPGFTLKDLSGQEHSLKDFRGKIVVLHFQSMTCPWDGAYQSHLNDTAEQYADGGEGRPDVQFLAINANRDEPVNKLSDYHKKTEMPYPILKDTGNEVADEYGAQTTPHIFIIDAKGVLQYKGGVEAVPASVSDVGNMDTQYLGPVLAAMVKGEKLPYTQTKSKGCTIKRER